MCKLKSGLLFKDHVFMPEYDSHENMLKELGIEDDVVNASKMFVRVELSPKDNEWWKPIDEWEFRKDQDIIPDWYDAADAEQRTREAVKEWAKTHIYVNAEMEEIKDGKGILIYGGKVSYICGNAQVSEICDNAQVSEICDNAQVNHIYGNATVSNFYGNAQVSEICDNAQVNHIYGNAVICRGDWAKQKDCTIKDDAIWLDRAANKIYCAKKYKLVNVSKSKLEGKKK